MSENIPVLPSDDRSSDQGRHGRDATSTFLTGSIDGWRNRIWKSWNCSLWIHVTGIYHLSKIMLVRKLILKDISIYYNVLEL